MRKWLFAVCAIALVMSGCVTVPPTSAIGSAATPVIHGPESGYTGAGEVGTHEWTDDQARTLLWLRRNFPELLSDVPFPFITLFSYNIHQDTRPYMPFEWNYYFANPRDPSLQIRMMTLESRDRNRTRRDEVLTRKAMEEAAAEQAITGDISQITDREVSKKLETVFP